MEVNCCKGLNEGLQKGLGVPCMLRLRSCVAVLLIALASCWIGFAEEKAPLFQVIVRSSSTLPWLDIQLDKDSAAGLPTEASKLLLLAMANCLQVLQTRGRMVKRCLCSRNLKALCKILSRRSAGRQLKQRTLGSAIAPH